MLEMIKKLSYNSDLFSLKIKQTKKITEIDMQLFTPFVNTSELPYTLDFLESEYPTVLKTECFNENNLPFIVEVNATEIGHLFEHILIDELCSLKIKAGAKSAIFNGNTSWNWKINPYGSFQIWIDIGKDDLNLLIEGLKKTIYITKKLIQPNINTLNLRATTLDHPQTLLEI